MEVFPFPASADYSYRQRFTVDHRGTDILAPFGTPVLAVEPGKAWGSIETRGGTVVYLDGVSGNRYFYGHLGSWAPSMLPGGAPVSVEAGEDLGSVGNTGNAAGGPPHLHFQIRRGSLTIDPFDSLQAVDPHPERGTPGETVHRKPRPPGPIDRAIDQATAAVLPPVVLLLALYWAANRAFK